MTQIPACFERHTRRSPLTDPWEPIYARSSESAVILAIRADDNHCNSRGFVHGGLVTSLADNAMGLSCAKQSGNVHRLVTISLAVDFLAPIDRGKWVEIDTTFVKVGGSICFAQAFVTADGAPCARASGTFRILRPKPATSDVERAS